MKQTDKLLSINWLRGFASFSVCVTHMFCAVDYFTKNDGFYYKHIFLTFALGRLGVPIFFVISGFVIPYSMYRSDYKLADIKYFLSRRMIRIEPPYLLSIPLTLLVQFLVLSIKGEQNSFSIDWLNIILHFGYLTAFEVFHKLWINGVCWTLAVEFHFYLLISVLFVFLVDVRKIVSLGSLWLLMLLSVIITYYYSTSGFYLGASITHYYPLFQVGILTFLKKTNKIGLLSFIIQCAISLFIVYKMHHIGFASACAFASIIILFNWNIPFNFLHYLGKISFSLYLVHWVIGIELIRTLALYYYPAITNNQKLVVATIGVIASVAFAHLFYLIIEKRSLKWANSLTKKKPTNIIDKKIA